MSQLPNQPLYPGSQPGPGQLPVQTPPPRPRVRRRFRWSLVTVPAAIFLVVWLLSGVEAGAPWHAVPRALGAANELRYSQLAILGLLGIAACVVLRVLRKKGGNP